MASLLCSLRAGLPGSVIVRQALRFQSYATVHAVTRDTTASAVTEQDGSYQDALVAGSGGIREKKTFQLKKYKPVSPGIRWLRRPVNDHLHKGRAFLPLTIAKRGQGGRNSGGQVTVRHQGGGHKRRLRTIDFKRTTPGVQVVERIEHDPGRSGHIALVSGPDGTKSYILACDGLRAGDRVESYLAGIPDALIKDMGGSIDPGMLAARTVQRGNCLPLHMIPVGTIVHAISIRKDGPAKFARSAGTYAQIITAPKKGYAVVKMQSGELRKIPADASATIGIVSNTDHHHRKLGKAGRSRWLGIRPTVRGVAMNAYEHPHGGGHGGGRGNKPTSSIWGWKTKGYKTRRSVHNQNRFLVKGRPRGKEKNMRS